MKREIVIIGAGPAGSTVARILADKSRDVLLIDKESFPRHKVCGGGIPKRTKTLLDFDYSEVVEGVVNSVILSGGWAKSLQIDVDVMAEIVARENFDNLLLQEATKSGCEFKGACKVKYISKTTNGYEIEISDTDKKIEAENLCIACGPVISFRSNMELEKIPLGIALEGYVDYSADLAAQEKTTAIFDFTCINGGYGWVFPRENKFTVGIGTSDWKCPSIKNRLFGLCKTQPVLRNKEIYGISGAPLPFFKKSLNWYAKSNLYRIGDSAGFADPLTGEGIYYAIQSGIFAAESILKNDEASYELALRDKILPELMVAYRYARKAKLVPKWLMRLVMGTGKYREYAHKFVSLLSGELTYRQLYKDMHGGKDFKL